MLLFLPLDKAREAGFPFEVDPESVFDLGDGVLSGQGPGEAKSPFAVFQRAQFKLCDRAEVAVGADVRFAVSFHANAIQPDYWQK